MLVQAEVRNQLLELAVLLLEQLQPPQLADTQAVVHLIPAAKGRFGDTHPPDHLGHRYARLRLLQRERDLLVAVPRLLHRQLLPRGSTKAGKLSLNPDEETGRTSVHLGVDVEDALELSERNELEPGRLDPQSVVQGLTGQRKGAAKPFRLLARHAWRHVKLISERARKMRRVRKSAVGGDLG